MQFSEIVEILQDELDGVYADNDDDDDDNDVIIDKKTKLSSSSSLSSSLSQVVDNDNDDDWNDTDDMKEIAIEIFDELRGDATTLSVANFKKWDDVKDMISTKAISSSELDDAIKKVGVMPLSSSSQSSLSLTSSSLLLLLLLS